MFVAWPLEWRNRWTIGTWRGWGRVPRGIRKSGRVQRSCRSIVDAEGVEEGESSGCGWGDCPRVHPLLLSAHCPAGSGGIWSPSEELPVFIRPFSFWGAVVGIQWESDSMADRASGLLRLPRSTHTSACRCLFISFHSSYCHVLLGRFLPCFATLVRPSCFWLSFSFAVINRLLPPTGRMYVYPLPYGVVCTAAYST